MAAEWEIVPAQAEDAQTLRGIWNDVILQDDAFVFEKAFSSEEFAALLAAQHRVYCAVNGGQVGGFYILHPNLSGRASHVANCSYAVHRGMRGQGLGRKLAVHSLEMAKQLGYRAMQFNAVVQGNTAANALWRELGFQLVGVVPAAFRLRSGALDGLCIYHKAL